MKAQDKLKSRIWFNGLKRAEEACQSIPLETGTVEQVRSRLALTKRHILENSQTPTDLQYLIGIQDYERHRVRLAEHYNKKPYE